MTPGTGNRAENFFGQLKKLGIDELRKYVLYFFVTTDIPFHKADNVWWQRIIQAASDSPVSSRIPVSRKTIRADLAKEAVVVQDKLKEILQKNESKISLSLDCWTNESMTSAFMAVNCYWIDKHFNLNECLLGFRKLSGSHTGVYLAEELLSLLDKFGIVDKLMCITTDHASNNKTMMERLQTRLEFRGLDWNAGEMHISCLNHVINLAVQDFLKSIKVINEEGEAVDGVEENSFVATLAKVRSLAKVWFPCIVQINADHFEIIVLYDTISLICATHVNQ
jgi:hypothetical protein